jgi:hypothetical protein
LLVHPPPVKQSGRMNRYDVTGKFENAAVTDRINDDPDKRQTVIPTLTSCPPHETEVRRSMAFAAIGRGPSKLYWDQTTLLVSRLWYLAARQSLRRHSFLRRDNFLRRGNFLRRDRTNAKCSGGAGPPESRDRLPEHDPEKRKPVFRSDQATQEIERQSIGPKRSRSKGKWRNGHGRVDR